MDREHILERIAGRRDSVEKGILEDREAFLALSMTERGRALSQACAAVMSILRGRTDREEVERILMQSEPPHPSYLAFKKRIRKGAEGKP